MNKFRRILDGWKNFVFKSPIVELLALERAKICAQCDEAQERLTLTAIIGEPIKEIEMMVCLQCSCPLSAKLRSAQEICPHGKW